MRVESDVPSCRVTPRVSEALPGSSGLRKSANRSAGGSDQPGARRGCLSSLSRPGESRGIFSPVAHRSTGCDRLHRAGPHHQFCGFQAAQHARARHEKPRGSAGSRRYSRRRSYRRKAWVSEFKRSSLLCVRSLHTRQQMAKSSGRPFRRPASVYASRRTPLSSSSLGPHRRGHAVHTKPYPFLP